MASADARPVVHLELHTAALADAREFYARLCGWKAERIETPFGCYEALGLGRHIGGDQRHAEEVLPEGAHHHAPRIAEPGNANGRLKG